jgi:hypothetical protein
MIDDLDRTAEELLTREFSSALLDTPKICFFASHSEFMSNVTLPADPSMLTRARLFVARLFQGGRRSTVAQPDVFANVVKDKVNGGDI